MLKEVSIIIPNYNSGPWLRKTIESCLDQIIWIKDIIVVDDHSTDSSIASIDDLIARYSEIKIFTSPQKGAAPARNFGFLKSTGKFIQWLDADDYILNSKFENQINCFLSFPGTDVVYSDWVLDTYNEKGDVVRKEEKVSRDYDDYLFELLKNNWQPNHSYLIRREVAQKNHDRGGWKSETTVAQDREYFTNIALLGVKFKHTPGFFCTYNRWRDNSVSQAQSISSRHLVISKLLNGFLNQVNSDQGLSKELKKKYSSVIIGELLVSKLFNSEVKVDVSQIGFIDVGWRYISGFRTRLKAMILWFRLKRDRQKK